MQVHCYWTFPILSQRFERLISKMTFSGAHACYQNSAHGHQARQEIVPVQSDMHKDVDPRHALLIVRVQNNGIVKRPHIRAFPD